jgi:DUF4097 and DUF4098 domain-containing protein YvlB
MKGTKIGLLLLILAFGSTVETAWRVRHHLGPGGFRWFMWGDRFHGPSFAFAASQTETVEAGTPVEVDNSFGAVKVFEGDPGAVRIALRKVVFLGTEAKAREFADRIQVKALKEGGALRVSTNRADLESARAADADVGFETHLDLAVPPGTVVRVHNEHGAIDVADVAGATLTGSHDAVRLQRVGGPAEIEARHGDVEARGIKGALRLVSRHGDVTVSDVEGRATLDVQHGQVSASRVAGLVVSSAHGDVTAEGVQGDLEVRGQHGGVRAVEISGRAAVETSFDGITLEKVGGDASAHTEHGDVSLTDVTGAVDAQASFDDVTLTRIGGPATVVVRHGAARGHGLEKGARVRASGDEVVLEGFRGPVEVEAERASIRLAPADAIAAAVTVRATHGAIDLEVPPGSRFELQASADHGQITTDVPGLGATQMSVGKLAGTLGAGGNLVSLTTTHADVTLRRAAEVAEKSP